MQRLQQKKRIASFASATELCLATTEKSVNLYRDADSLSWRNCGISLTVRCEELECGTRFVPLLRNEGGRGVNIESVELMRSIEQTSQPVRFLRFGFNMPSDPVFFGTLSNTPAAVNPARKEQAEENSREVEANSLLVLKEYAGMQCVLVGAETFRLSEGTITLEYLRTAERKDRDDKYDVMISYRSILDGMRLDPGSELSLDSFIVLSGTNLNQVLRNWSGMTAGIAGARIPQSIPTGWNDWQYYRNEKTQEDVLQSASVIADLRKQGYPLDFIQVDGGFCMHISEWTQPGPGFPDGIQSLSEKIRGMGLRFGLWFAPYIQNVETSVVKQHPEWLLREKHGEKPVLLERSNVGPSCLIDYTVPGTLDWLREQVRLFVREFGVEWMKLDGPNCGTYRQGRLSDPYKTVTQMIGETLAVIREECGEGVLLEGEGIMGPALGKVDLHRVQQDNHQIWYHDGDERRPHAPTVYGKELVMSFLHNRWWCNHRENVSLRDFPSPFFHGKTRNPHAVESLFSENELQTQLVAAVLGSGGLLLSDPMQELRRTPDRMKYASMILPVWPEAAEIVDSFPDTPYPSAYRLSIELEHESYTVLGVINWFDEYRDFSYSIPDVVNDNLCQAGYFMFSFFDRKCIGPLKDMFHVNKVPPHGCRLIALRGNTGMPQLVSTDMHLLQGAVDLESVNWKEDDKMLSIVVKHFDQRDARLFLHVPGEWEIESMETNAARHSLVNRGERFPEVRFDGGENKRTFFNICCRSFREASKKNEHCP